MNLNDVSWKKFHNSNLVFSLFLVVLSSTIALLFPTLFYETTDDPLYRIISTGDFNSILGPDSHVNFTSYFYLKFLIFLKKIINFNYFWDFFNYLIAFFAIMLIFYQLLKLPSRLVKIILLVLAIVHFPSYFISFHLTKISGLLVASAFITQINLLNIKKENINYLFINILILIFAVLLCSITRLKAPLLYIPTLVFCSIPILAIKDFSNLNFLLKSSIFFLFLILISLTSINWYLSSL